MPKTVLPAWPSSYPAVAGISLSVDGEDCRVLDGTAAEFACWQSDDAVQIDIRGQGRLCEASVHPLTLGIKTRCDEDGLHFTAPAGANLFVQIPGRERLYLFSSPIDHAAPDPDDPTVHYFRAGQVYEVGILELGSGETLYVEAGAVVRGKLRCYGGEHVTLAGAGLIDGAAFSRRDPMRHLVHVDGVRGLRMRDLTLINPPSWTNVNCGCSDIIMENLHQIGPGCGNDGIDLVSAQQVRISKCFIHSGDDCVVVKAIPDGEKGGEHGCDRQAATGQACRDILVEGCVFMNDGGGSAMEIGHELRCSTVSQITFRDCDVLGVHGFGAAFCINNMEGAEVSDICYDRIRVEHHYDHLLQFVVSKSRYSRQEGFGSIHDVTLRDCTVALSEFNIGYSHSIIGGASADNPVHDIRIEKLRYGDRFATGLDDIACFTRNTEGITFG